MGGDDWCATRVGDRTRNLTVNRRGLSKRRGDDERSNYEDTYDCEFHGFLRKSGQPRRDFTCALLRSSAPTGLYVRGQR